MTSPPPPVPGFPPPLPAMTTEAAACVEAAGQEAARLGHAQVAGEHLVLALLAMDEPALCDHLDQLGVSAESARAALERSAGRARASRGAASGDDRPALTSLARRVLGRASNRAEDAGRPALALEDLQAALLEDSQGPLARLKEDPRPARPAPPPPPREAASPPPPPPPLRQKNASSPAKKRREEEGPREERVPSGRSERRRREEVSAGRMVPGDTRRDREGSRGQRERPVPAPKPRSAPAAPSPGGIIRPVLLLAVPASITLAAFGLSPLAVFATSCLAVVPLAGYMGEATEHLARRTGPTLGGLMNATFGNAAELIIAAVALNAGLVTLVKASITGSILGNLLMILGLSFVAGGVRMPVVRFNQTAAGMSAGMLALAVAGLVFPALFHAAHPQAASQALHLSEGVALVLAATYGFSLLFTLITHRRLFDGTGDEARGQTDGWGVGKAIAILAAATLAVVVESELLVRSVEHVTLELGLSQAFLGLIIVPIIGNAAEHATAVMMARKGHMDLSLQIALGSSTQVALLVAPALVLLGILIGHRMDLVFTPFEVIALGLSTIVVSILTLDGESNWFEGVQLLAVYALIAVAAFFV